MLTHIQTFILYKLPYYEDCACRTQEMKAIMNTSILQKETLKKHFIEVNLIIGQLT
jgi:hypothetical protein